MPRLRPAVEVDQSDTAMPDASVSEDKGEDGDDASTVGTNETEDDENDDGSPTSYIDSYFASTLPPTRTPLCCVLLSSPECPVASDITALSYHNYLSVACSMLLRHYSLTLLRSDAAVRANRSLPRIPPAEIKERAEGAAGLLFGRSVAGELKSAVSAMNRMGVEFRRLPVAGKVGVMKLLVEACYDTARVRGVVEDNASGRWQAEQRVEVDRKNKRREERNMRKEVRNLRASGAKKRRELRQFVFLDCELMRSLPTSPCNFASLVNSGRRRPGSRSRAGPRRRPRRSGRRRSRRPGPSLSPRAKAGAARSSTPRRRRRPSQRSSRP